MPDTFTTDPTIKPGDNFYQYANKPWLDAHPIPADKSRIGAFTILNDENTERLHVLLEDGAHPDDSHAVTVLRAFYNAAMNEAAIEAAGVAPVQPLLEQISALSSVQEIMNLMGQRLSNGRNLIWHVGVDVDDKNSQRYIVRFDQSGLGLPDRDYYLEDNERFVQLRLDYVAYMTQMFTLLGSDNAAAQAQTVMKIETELARASWSAVACRNVEKMYNLYTPAKLTESFPNFEWDAYLKAAHLEVATELQIAQPDFMTRTLELLHELPVSEWQSYLTMSTMRPLGGMLPKVFSDLSFDFYGKKLSGMQEQEARYKRVIGSTLNLLSEPIGRLFVEEYFDEASKTEVIKLVDDIKIALAHRIDNLDWMGAATKAKAHEKLATFLPLLGYPDKWRSYEGLEPATSYLSGILDLYAYDWLEDTQRLSREVNRTEWLMSAALVNAYYWPSTNGITFPAGILQAPYFDATFDPALNYGGIGSVIGHEMIHGFDDSGAKYDATGNLESWWTEDDKAAFDTRAEQLANAYDAYKVDGRAINGHLTLGENIADLGGTIVAYDALQARLNANPELRVKIDGFTQEQRFFLAYALNWRQNTRPELALQALVSDPHSPSEYRVNGVVTHLDEFYKTFNVTVDTQLYRAPKDRIRIW